MKNILYLLCTMLFFNTFLCAQKDNHLKSDLLLLSKGSIIAIAPVGIRFIDIKNDTLLPLDRLQGSKVAHFFDQKVAELLSQKNLVLCINDSLTTPEWSRLLSMGYALSRTSLPKELQSEIKAQAATTGCSYLLLSDIRVKVGDKAEWEGASPFHISLVVHPQTHITRIRVAILDTVSGLVQWKNESEMRGIPEVEHPEFTKLIQTIFSNIKTK